METNQNINPVAALTDAAASLARMLAGDDAADFTGSGVPSVGPVEENLHSVTSVLDDASLIEVVKLTEDLHRKVQALQVAVAHEVATRGSLCRDHGHKTPRSFLQALTLAPGADISARLRVGAAVSPTVSETGEVTPARFPEVGEALETGLLGLSAAGTIVNTLTKVDTHVNEDMVHEAEESLVAAATSGVRIPDTDPNISDSTNNGASHLPVHADNLRSLSKGWLGFLNGNGTPSKEELEAKRYFYIGPEKNGLVPIHGLLLPEVATKFGRVIDAITNPRAKKTPSFQPTQSEDATARTSESPEGVEDFVDPRTPDQLRHDAIATAIGFALKNNEVPNLGGEAVSLVIQVTDKELLKKHGTAWIQDSHGETIPVDASAARHASCVGGVTRVLMNENGKVVELGTQDRLFNAVQRKAIQYRDGGCIIPGCVIPFTWCEVHHVKEHQAGGETHVDNGVLLCWYHHRHIEENGWSVKMNDGVPEVRAPKWMDPDGVWRKHQVLHRPVSRKAAGSTTGSRNGDVSKKAVFRGRSKEKPGQKV